jgi:hypothetical protein
MCLKPVFWIDWVNGHQRFRVFNYADGVYTLTAYAGGRAARQIGGDGTLTWKVNGSSAMNVTAAGLVVIGLLTNRLIDLAGPRLEFFRQQSVPLRLAALDSSGTLWVRDASEKTAVNHSSNDQFLLLGNAAITPGGILANAFFEGTPT